MLSGDRLVFWALNLSDFVRSEQVEQKLNAGVKHPENPVLAPRPGHWDGTRCKVYGTVFYDREDSMLKMWYSGSEDTPDSIRREYGSYRHVGYAVSPDGVHWDRPNLGLIEYRGSKENNIIVLNAQAPSVFKGLDCPGIDSAYVMFTQAGQDTVETRVLFSDDGARWAVRKDNATGKGEWGVKSHEPFSILYDPDEPKPDFRWKGYSLVHVFRNGYRGRAVGFYHGATPFEWTEWERQPIMDTSFALESEIHIPHVTRFHDDYVMLYDAMEPWHDTQTEIALSRDGIGFERVRNGVPIVTRGRPDQHDAAKVCVSPRSLFVHDGKIWWYYTTSANNYQTCPRSGRAEPWYRYTCLAQWRQDGFAHLQTTAGGRSAMVETIPFELLSDDLDVRFNVLSPSPMKVEFLDETGRKLAVGRLPAGDSLSEPVAWDGEPKVGRGTTARLRFHLNGPKARFYSVSVAGAKRASCGVRRLDAAFELDCRIEKQIKFPRAGRSGVEPPHSKSRRRWTFQAGDKITAEPLVHGDRVYVGSWDERMYALDVATGERIWEFRTGNAVVAGAVVTGEKLVFGSHDGNVYALDLGSGKELWRRPMGSSEDVLLTPNGPWVECSPVAGEYKPGFPERLFVGSHHRRLAALNPETGVVCWEFPTFNWILGRPVVADYTVYFGCIDGWLYAVDAMCGALRWRYRVGEKLRYAPTVIPGSVRTKAITAGPLIHEGVIYIGAHDGFMHAVDRATGRAIWTREVGRVLPSKAVLRGNRLVAVTNDGLIVALEARSGRLDWRRDLRVTVHADLVPHDADSFWIAPVEGWMLRIGAAGGLVDNALAGGPVRATPCVTREGDLVVATCRGEIARIPTKGGGR